MTPARRSLMIAGGGTGGHILAGVAIAEEWKKQFGKDSRIKFVGAQGGIEERLVPRAGFPLELLQIGSLNRVSLGRRIKTLFQLPLSFLKSGAILLRERPSAIIGVGGYASGPLVLMGRLLGGLWGARTAILEQNSVPGMTNRILGRVVHRVYCAFPGTELQFGADKAQLTGNPVRPNFQRLAAPPSEHFTIFIFGGSQGAMGINSLIIDALTELRDLKGLIRFVHQTGERDFERVKTAHAAAGTESRVEKFIYEMGDCYRDASLVVCRAGSSTLSELATVGRAAILIPFPQAADNHQEKNARVFSDAGAAVLLKQGEATGATLAKVIRDLKGEPERLRAMELKVAQFDRPHSTQSLVSDLAQKLGGDFS